MIDQILKSKLFHSFRHDPSAIVGSALLIILIFGAIFAPVIAPQDPYNLEAVSLENFLTPPIWMDGGKYPFILGTDDQGRDIFSTILFGLRTSLIVACGVVFIAGIFGTLLGMLGGYYGGILDATTMRLADIFFSFSTTLMAFLMLGLFKQRGLLIIVLAISIADWVRYARTMRGSTLQVKEEAYIMAAKATGAGDSRLLFKHLLPNAIAPIFVVLAVDFAVVIMLEATLSFLGVGVPITRPSLGMMIAIGKNYIYAGKWWMVAFPGGALFGLIIGINLFADWLREELNPKIQR